MVHREMTVTELLDARERFAELHGKISDLEREKALAKQHYDGLIKPLATEADCLLTDIRTKMFDIDEDCYVIHDYAANKVRYYSKTTMSLVSAREMNDSDRQQDIDFENDQEQDIQECEGNGED